MNTSHLTLGKKGEKIAEKYLRQSGYRTIGRNVRTGGGEIDLVVRKGGMTVFVEVKTRKEDDGFAPSIRVDYEKIGRVKRAAEAWIEDKLIHGAKEFSARIDVIGVCEGKVVEHYEDVEV
jgi:putative endonuclease